MNESTKQPEALRIVIGRRLAAVAAVFIVVVSLLMAMNRYLLNAVDPLDTPALKTLIEQLDQAPENAELRQQVRELDWLARRAFFVRQGQIETGTILLLVAGGVFLIAWQLMVSGRAPKPAPRRCPGVNQPWTAATRARRVIAISGVLILLAVWVARLIPGWRATPPAPVKPDLPTPLAVTDGMSPAFAAHAADPAGTAGTNEPADAPGWPAALNREWPSFRGPGGLGIAPEADPPTAWDGTTGEGVLWKVEVPREGFSSPVVWRNRVFLTGSDDEKRDVYCYDADTGAWVWTADTEDVPGAPLTLPQVSADTGYAAPSVATDGQHVIAIFGTGVIRGLDFDGRRLWARHLGTPANVYGHASSPLILNNTVFVQFDQSSGSVLKALDAETGQDRWEQARQAATSWTSPILAEVDGRVRLILAGAPMVAAYDVLTGDEVWSRDVLSGEVGSSPAYAAGRVFAANQYARAAALDAVSGDLIWSSDELELPDAGSPVATDRFLFLPTSYGTFSCVNAADGARIWEHTFDAGGYASPLLAAGRIYWLTEPGVMQIFKASDTFEQIAEPKLGEGSVCTPALVGRRLYIRGVKHLFCMGAE